MTGRPNRLPPISGPFLLALALALVLAAATGCASSAAPGAATVRTATSPVSRAPSAASTSADPGPSPASRMVCTGYILAEIAGALGAETTELPAPTWAHHLYSCTYAYPDGSMLVSVKELSDPATAAAQFDGVRGSAGPVTTFSGLGERAFTRADGSTVVLKDSSVLTVDVSKLPPLFGKPPRSRSNVSVTIATTIMVCWKEHAE
ncbi:hypothetical protein C7C46_00010 [Streptomyces tateyamensis]|uniref:DUF3558 domain-containing protein n=1 Tax=Streptomyces tateyamensis TaxID=565073 RepID=A0A2V4PB58_9ACTN|nr:hypothetical protein [Streptomyces tateyamensis]PYC88506.1 hypothetical protein C7C46_00010 [Streptomyces tateyamensis]